MVSIALGVLILAVAVARLAAVVWATPLALWVEEYPRLVDPSVTVNPATQRWAQRLWRHIDDAALLGPAKGDCLAGEAAGLSFADCLPDVDRALQAAPASGELWLVKATVLAEAGKYGDSMWNALRNSYRTTPNEGWIASERVVFSLRVYSIMPPDLRTNVLSDLQLVLSTSRLAEPLVMAYAADANLRTSAEVPLHMLSEEQMRRFVGLVRGVMRDR